MFRRAAALLLTLLTLSFGLAAPPAPPPPETYDVLLRYQIAAFRTERLRQYHEMLKALQEAGFDTGASETPITPIMIGEASQAHAYSRALFEEGVFAVGIGYPTVPHGKARVRTIVTATHTRGQLDRAVDVLVRVARRMEILRG